MNRRGFFGRATGLLGAAAVASQIKELPKVEAAQLPIEQPKVPIYTDQRVTDYDCYVTVSAWMGWPEAEPRSGWDKK